MFETSEYHLYTDPINRIGYNRMWIDPQRKQPIEYHRLIGTYFRKGKHLFYPVFPITSQMSPKSLPTHK